MAQVVAAHVKLVCPALALRVVDAGEIVKDPESASAETLRPAKANVQTSPRRFSLGAQKIPRETFRLAEESHASASIQSLFDPNPIILLKAVRANPNINSSPLAEKSVGLKICNLYATRSVCL